MAKLKGAVNLPKDGEQRLAAEQYVEYVLSKGHALSRFLHETADLREGSIVTLSPGPLDSSQLLEFNWGHFPQKPVRPGLSPVLTSVDLLADLICETLVQRDQACILENFLFGVSDDQWLKRAKSCLVTNGAEVYHIVLPGRTRSRTRKGAIVAISEAEHLPFFAGAVGQLAPKCVREVTKTKRIGADVLKAFGETAQCVFVGAYDAEGYVVWKGDGKTQRPRRRS